MLQLSFGSLSADGNSNRGFLAFGSSASLLPQTPQEPPSVTKSSAPSPRWDLLYPDEPISVKIVSQRYLAPEQTVWDHRIGWISVTNTAGQIIYDPFVTYPKEPGLKKHFSNRRYDVAKEDLMFRNGARDGKEVERNLMKLFDGRTVVVHGGKGYSDSCYYYEDALGDSLVWDTQTLYADMQNDGQPTLSTVARLVLGRSIRQDGEDARRPDQDATTAMELYLLRFPYDREAKRVQYEANGWTPESYLRSPPKKRNEIRKAKSTMIMSTDLGSGSTSDRRPGTGEGARPQSAPPDKTLNAAAQFALRLQRRHFADLGTDGARESRQEVF
ncbi:Putative ribonuclease H superfamily [Septoria linicola]|uniref:Ribonuclease H superfamily n=1 Tax=Septoria linicola TaxID=215465 RepID=A0A9Q9EGS8_9PEZI|nr:putative ribonuclease H superfamily [Septoria linicola]USW51106.1 Putative ribonuclease H superfamily [Septoria linicola]